MLTNTSLKQENWTKLYIRSALSIGRY